MPYYFIVSDPANKYNWFILTHMVKSRFDIVVNMATGKYYTVM